MRNWRSLLVAGAAAAAGWSADGVAQEEAPAAELETVVVVGSRAQPRLETQTAAPVDVFTAAELQARGYTELARALQFLAPSLNYPRTATGPSGANTRAVTLRGLGPDQLLVLVDGKRRHASSVLNFNNVIGRGTVPVDLNTIPMSAIERIEILRDGAAAQYGSDAIAGVINIVLRRNAQGGMAELQGGVTEDGDGDNLRLAANKGVGLGGPGFVSLSGEATRRDFTNGAAVDSRYGRVTNRQGDPESLNLNLALNAGYEDASGITAYGNLIVAQRDSESAAQYRDPSVSPLYPDGFLPLIALDQTDIGATSGLRGKLAGWDWDLSDTGGYNRADFEVSDSVNTSLGTSSPRSFDAGGTRYAQNLVDLGVSRWFDSLLQGLSLAAGLEHRYESFELEPGEPAAFAGAGAQGFPGFNPTRPVNEDREAVSAYLDTELSVLPTLRLGAALRHERYQGFDAETTGKLSLFARPLPPLALRATAGTGFRAPSLQQRYFSTVSSQSSGGVLVNVGTFAVDDPVAQALGASPLEAETSEQYSVGFVLTPLPRLSLSLDWFSIDIDDRIILSESLSGAAVDAVLAAAGVTNVRQVRFFTNAADTETRGYEATLAWGAQLPQEARLDTSLAYMSVDTQLRSIDTNAAVPSLPLLGLPSIDLLTEAQPEDKLSFNNRLRWRRWSGTLDVVRFGSFRTVPVRSEQEFSAVVTVDLGLGYQFERLSLEAGVLNATDEYADKVAERDLTQGGSLQYPETGAIGSEGREYYLRLRTAL